LIGDLDRDLDLGLSRPTFRLLLLLLLFELADLDCMSCKSRLE
jgi:hypothetical protein